MKKYSWAGMAAVLLSVALTGGCAPAAGETPEKDKVSLYDRGLRIIEQMDTMAECEEYWNMMTSSEEMGAVIREIGAQDYSSPRAVYQIKQSKESMDLLINYLGGESSYNELPQELRTELERRLTSSIASRFSAMAGVEALGAASVISLSDHFIDSSLTENLTYFYIYDSGYWGAVTFLPYEEGIVHASGLMIKSDGFGGADEEELFREFMENGGLTEGDFSRIYP